MEDRERISGRIEFEGVTYSRAVQRFVEKRVRQWLTAHFDGAELESLKPLYSVTFRRQGQGHTINCNLEIQLGTQNWVSFRYGSGPHNALAQCLEHLSRGRAEIPDYDYVRSPSDERRRKVVFVPA